MIIQNNMFELQHVVSHRKGFLYGLITGATLSILVGTNRLLSTPG